MKKFRIYKETRTNGLGEVSEVFFIKKNTGWFFGPVWSVVGEYDTDGFDDYFERSEFTTYDSALRIVNDELRKCIVTKCEVVGEL